jgi:molybdopterin-guanine dinucleotide biosynthesis protein A
MTVAIVLAGGRSTRFGSEKAMALFKGEPLIAEAVRRLSDQGLRVAINAPANSGAAAWASARGHVVVGDDPSDPKGPLAGIKAGLLWAESHGARTLATSPCDTPNLPPDLETKLTAALSDAAGAVTVRSPSGLQPLCSVWRVAETLAALSSHFAQGRHPAVHDLLAELSATEVVFGSDAPFANLNRPGDLARG